jgi:hypothetical protein
MRMKAGFLAGFAVGYVLGTKAGQERYQQIVEAARRLLDAPEAQRLNGGERSWATRSDRMTGSAGPPPGYEIDDTPPYEQEEGSEGDQEQQTGTSKAVGQALDVETTRTVDR